MKKKLNYLSLIGISLVILSCKKTNYQIPPEILPFTSIDYYENWNINYHQEGDPKYKSERLFLGLITFTLKEDSLVEVKYKVFNSSLIDQGFKNNELNYYLNQSCGSFNFKPAFMSFHVDSLYYQVVPCYNCNTEQITKCKELAIKLSKFHTKQTATEKP